jgi:hypothetical protein
MKNKQAKKYDWICVFKETKERMLKNMRGDETQEIFINKLLDLYDKMVGTKILKNIEKIK